MIKPSDPTTNDWRVLLATGAGERSLPIERGLAASPYRLLQTIILDDKLVATVERVQPDILILEFAIPPPGLAEQLRRVIASRRLPIIVFAARSSAEDVRSAIRAGVSAYVVDGLRDQRVLPVLEAAMTRFIELEDLRLQRDLAQAKLGERREVERAKGILMARRHLDEQAAYDALRKLAMDRGLKMIEAARNVIAAEELLGDQK